MYMYGILRSSHLLRKQTIAQATKTSRSSKRSVQIASAAIHEARLPQASNDTNMHFGRPEMKMPMVDHILQQQQQQKQQQQEQKASPSEKTSAVDSQISSLPLVQSLTAATSYTLSRPHFTMPSHLKPNHLVAGALAGPGKVSVAPYMWTSKRERGSGSRLGDVVSVFHVGPELCGHPGFVHGGLLSVLFDEVFARCVSTALPSGLGMTANLNVDYRKPATPDRLYVLRAQTVKVEGRKAWVEGKMTCLPAVKEGGEGGEIKEEDGVMVAEAKALFIEPKFAESMVPLYKN